MLGYFNYTTWLTYMGLFSGVCGILFTMEGKLTLAIFCLLFSGFLDLFDGKVASTKKDRTEDMKRFGIQIDSLSDLVCFCVLPAAFLLALVRRDLQIKSTYFYPLAAIFVLSGLIRLAYFNVMEENRQKKETTVRKTYHGIPVTTTAVVVPFFHALYSLIYALSSSASTKEKLVIYYVWFVAAELFFFAFAFLFKGFKIKKLHGKSMLIPVVIGVIALVAVLIACILNFK